MKRDDVIRHMASMTLSEFDQQITQEGAHLNKMARDSSRAALFLFVPIGACIYFDAPMIAAFLGLVVLYLKQMSVESTLEASMLKANWWLALMIQGVSQDLLRIRENQGLTEEDDDEEFEDGGS